ncbi:MAG: EamA family transporter [Flavobacteriales bacterium]
MIYLVLSLLTSSAIFLLFKVFKSYNINTLQAIVLNYFTATALGLYLVSGELNAGAIEYSPLIRNGALLGFLFIGLFYLMAKISQEMGAGISSVATKLSLVIPAVLFMVIDSNDSFSWLKILALVIAIPGVYYTVKTKEKGEFSLLLPLLLFLGSGMLDFVLAYTDQTFARTNTDKILLTFLPFTVAGITGLVTLALSKNQNLKFSRNTIIGGIILGLINFGSIYFLLKTFDSLDLVKSQIIPINNLGVVILSALSAFLLLNERLSKTNKMGLLLSITAIGFLLVDSFV